MRKGYLIATAIIIALVAASAITIPMIMREFASQSETDNTDDLETSLYVKAEAYGGGMISIPQVKYTESSDGTYTLASSERTISGSIEVKTPDDNVSKMNMVISFENPASWLLMETMSISTQRDSSFVVLVDGSMPQGMRITTILEDGTASWRSPSAGAIPPRDGHKWMAWGVREITGPYLPAYIDQDNYNGNVILVETGYNVSTGVNVVELMPNNVVSVLAGLKDGYRVEGENWVLWNPIPGSTPSSYEVSSRDGHSIEPIYKAEIYNALTGTGVAGKPSEDILVKTGNYKFTMDIKYKSQVKVTPSEFDGTNMVSSIVFLLNETSPLDYKWIRVGFDKNGGDGTTMDSQKLELTAPNLKANEYTRTNYKFVGWSLTPSGEVKYKDRADASNLIRTDDGTHSTKTLYAQWEPTNES